ncbi:MAG: SAF domain-containing protein [Actinomycetes bacterium]
MRQRNDGRRLPARGRASNQVRGTALLARRLWAHRRWASALLLALAAALGVRTATADVPADASVLVAARDLAGGQRLSQSDLATARWPPDAVPDGLVPEDLAVGKTVSAPLRRGEPVTDARLSGSGQLVGQPPGTVAMSVPVPDATLLTLLHVGDAVRVLAGPAAPDGLDPGAAYGARVLVERAVVLALPPAPAAGLLDAGAGEGSVVLALSSADAVRVADSAARRSTALALLP